MAGKTPEQDASEMQETLYDKILVENSWSPEDAADLLSALSAPYLRRALRVLLLAAEERALLLLGATLTTPEGVQAAIRLQGEVKGVQHAVDELLVLACQAKINSTEGDDNG